MLVTSNAPLQQQTAIVECGFHGLISGLETPGCPWILMALAGTKKDAEASIFNDLQASMELCRSIFGAGNETRTRDPDLGKVVLYQLSYSRVVMGAILAISKTASTP